jgi:hypothetical protein
VKRKGHRPRLCKTRETGAQERQAGSSHKGILARFIEIEKERAWCNRARGKGKDAEVDRLPESPPHGSKSRGHRFRER